MKPQHDKTLKHRNGRNILYIELKSPFPEMLKELAEQENRSMKAQVEVIIMRHLHNLEITKQHLAAIEQTALAQRQREKEQSTNV